MPNSLAEIIRDAGGAAKVAEKIGQPPGTVRMWKMRGRVPPEHWRDLATNEIATLEQLAEIAAEKAA